MLCAERVLEKLKLQSNLFFTATPLSGHSPFVLVPFMAYLQCRSQTGIPTWIHTPNPMATLYCTKTVPIALNHTLIPIWIQIPNHFHTHFWNRYPFLGLGSETVSGSTTKRLQLKILKTTQGSYNGGSTVCFVLALKNEYLNIVFA